MRESISRFFGISDKATEEMQQTKEEIQLIPLEKIVANRYQPRTIFDDDKIDELCQTIKTHGIIQPIVVRELDGLYEIIAAPRGNHRNV